MSKVLGNRLSRLPKAPEKLFITPTEHSQIPVLRTNLVPSYPACFCTVESDPGPRRFQY